MLAKILSNKKKMMEDELDIGFGEPQKVAPSLTKGPNKIVPLLEKACIEEATRIYRKARDLNNKWIE
jgi:hypothetical protein